MLTYYKSTLDCSIIDAECFESKVEIPSEMSSKSAFAVPNRLLLFLWLLGLFVPAYRG